jgi:hypothetical protein
VEFCPPRLDSVVVFVLLVLLDYGDLCFFSFSLFVGKEALYRGSGGEEFAARVANGKVWPCFNFSTIFEARSTQFCRPLVDMCPPSLLAAVLWSNYCLLRSESSSVIGAWSSRVRVFSHLGPRMMATPCLFCLVWWRPGFSGDRLLQGIFRWRRVCYTRRLRWCFSSDGSFCFECFLEFDRLYLIVCPALN